MAIENEFGHKIGGSTRDLWRSRGLTVEDMEEMNDAERNEYVKKDSVWPKPDYHALKRQGVPVTVIYFRKLIRDAVSVKPVHASDAEYIQNVGELRQIAENIRSEADFQDVEKILKKHGFLENDDSKWIKTVTAKCHGIGGNSLVRVFFYSASKIDAEIKRKQFLYTPEEKILAPYTFITCTGDPKQFCDCNSGFGVQESYCRRYYDGKSTEEIRKLAPGTVIVCKYHTCVAVYNSRKEAEDDILQTADDIPTVNTSSKSKKSSFLYKQLDKLEQSDPEPFIKTGEDYIETFGFYGGEFGTWLSESERQKNLDMGYVAFKNIAIALDIDTQSIALGGNLSIAFGARGRGVALAHYEPLRKVINLTKWKGAGSLAHEYGHAMDSIISEMDAGDCMVSFMKRDSYTLNRLRTKSAYAAVGVIRAMRFKNPDKYEMSQFYYDSQEFDRRYSKNGGYWASTHEMFARAFACYIKDKLAEKGITDDYLCGHAESASDEVDGKKYYAYPVGEDRIRINDAIDNLISAWKEEGYLKPSPNSSEKTA